MAGNTNFPTSLDDDTSLYDVSDGVNTLQAAHHNNIKEAVKALERKVGVDFTSSPTALDYRVGNATNSHRHDGASGQGQVINPTTVPVPSGAAGGTTIVSLHEHLMDAGIHAAAGGIRATGIATVVGTNVISVPSAIVLGATGNATYVATGIVRAIDRYIHSINLAGSAVVGSNVAIPITIGRTMIIDNISAALRRGPSGATAAFIVRVGPTNVHQASPGNAPRFAPGATRYGHASPNLGTYPSGAIITLDVEAIGSSTPGEDLSITFVFRD